MYKKTREIKLKRLTGTEIPPGNSFKLKEC